MRMSHEGRGRSAGFTIIELMIVMVMVGIVVALAAPNVDPTRNRMNSSMQLLGTTMLTAQRQAMYQQHDIVVRVDTAERRLRVHEDRDNDGSIDTGEHERSVPIGEGVVFGRGGAPAMGFGSAPVVFTRTIGGLPAVVFHRDGSASSAGGFYVTSLRESRYGGKPADTRAITVARATGRAAWFRYRADGWQKAF